MHSVSFCPVIVSETCLHENHARTVTSGIAIDDCLILSCPSEEEISSRPPLRASWDATRCRYVLGCSVSVFGAGEEMQISARSPAYICTAHGAQESLREVLASLYYKPSDTEWVYGDTARSRMNRHELVVQFVVIPLLQSVRSGAQALPPQVHPNHQGNKTAQACSLRVGDPVYVYGSPFPQLQADALRKSMRFGHVSCVVRNSLCNKQSRGMVHSGEDSTQRPLKAHVYVNAEDSEQPPSLYLLDFKGLPGMDGSAILDATGELRAVLLPCLHNSALGALLWFALPIEAFIDAIWNSSARQAPIRASLMCRSSAKPVGSKLHTMDSSKASSHTASVRMQTVDAQTTATPAPLHVLLERHPKHSSCSSPRCPCCVRYPRYPRYPAAQHLLQACVQQPSYTRTLESAQRTVVLVKLSSGWGSGVIVDTELGIVLTNAHLFEHRGLQELPSSTSAARQQFCQDARALGPSYGTPPHMADMRAEPMRPTSTWAKRQACESSMPDRLASTRLWRQKCQIRWTHPTIGASHTFPATVVHMFRKTRELDVAVLQALPTAGASLHSIGALSAHMVQDHRLFRQGASVAAVGHSLMGPSASVAPSASVGCVSKVIPDTHTAHTGRAMSQTSRSQSAVHTLVVDCWIHSGCSGGALILLEPDSPSQDDGYAWPTQSGSKKEPRVTLLGLVASNAALKRGGVVPGIGFAVAGTVLGAVVSAAQKDIAACRSLSYADYHSPELERIDRPQSKL